MKVVLDFDDTIFNTHQLIREFIAVFSRLGFQEEQFWSAYTKCKEKAGGFDKEVLIDLFAELKSFDKEGVSEKIDFVINRSKKFVYPDFFDFADSFKKKDLILLSFGTNDFQRIKIENTGVPSKFKEVIITNQDKVFDLKDILRKNRKEKIFFIDNKANQIDKVKEELPQIITMQMNRLQSKHSYIKSRLTDYVIKDLYKAEDMISKIMEIKGL